jgi:hypothetical protein
MFGDPPPAIGRFDLIGRIGEGAAGIVWKAHDRELDRTVAIKILRRAAVGEPTHAFEEARSMARAVHPGIAAVHDVGVWRGSPYLVMEYVDGVRLGAWVEAGRPSPAAVVRVLAEVAHGLAAAHRNGLVHRDVKPDNILVRPDGAAKLLDFGVASLSQVARSDQDETSGDDDPSTVAGGGTPRYMAPEQLAGIGVDARSDQYALALTLYEALTGTLPPRLERTGAHRTESQDRGPLPARTWAAIRRALSASPDQRFHDVDAFMAAARPGARWWLVASAAAVVVLVGSGLAMYVVQPRPCEVPGIVERLVAADLPASTWPTLQTTHPEPQAQRDRIERHLRDEGQAWARLVAETCGDPKAARCLDRAALARGERLRAMDEVEEAFAPSVPRRVLALHAPAHCLRSADEPSPLGDQAEADLGAIASAREHRQLGDTQRARTIIEGVLREEPLSDEVRSRALLELGVVQANLFENTSAEASLLEVIDLAKRTGRAVHAVESMLVLASLYEQDDREAEGRGLIAAASVLAHREQDRVRWEVLLHVVLAESRYASKDGDFERALEILEGVRAEVEAAGTSGSPRPIRARERQSGGGAPRFDRHPSPAGRSFAPRGRKR